MVRAALLGLLPTAVLQGCGQVSDPSVPCAAMDLGAAAPATVTSTVAAPVVVVSAEDPYPFVVVRVCPPEDECVLYRKRLPGAAGEDGVGISHGSAVMVTARGNYVVGIDRKGGGLHTWEIDLQASTLDEAVGPRWSRGVGGLESPAVLVASMRDSDLLLVRDGADRLGVFDPQWDSPRLLAEDHPNLKVVAIGEGWLVGREDIDGDRERLLLVPVVDRERREWDGPEELVESSVFSRVEITANDEHVVATSGEGDGAETFVFEVASGALVDRFIGAAVTGLRELESVPGLRASSPDGSHLAYRTSTGALALRDLDRHSACLVRSASAGDHRVAGFSADGTIYMQAELAYTESRVFAFDTRTRSLVALDTEPGTGHHLAAAPARLPANGRPWAIGVRHGQYAGMQADEEPVALGIYDAVWLARDDEQGAMWAAETYRNDGSQRHLALRRFEPTLQGRRYEFPNAGDAAAHPRVLNVADNAISTLATLDNGDRPCLSTGTPGGWAYQCASSSSSASFAAAPVPNSEDPVAPETRDPEIPDYGDDDEGADEGLELDGGSESGSTDG